MASRALPPAIPPAIPGAGAGSAGGIAPSEHNGYLPVVPDHRREDLAEVARALLQWEQVLGGPGFPPAQARASEAPPDAGPALRVLAQDAATCTRCRLHEGRTKSVFSRGSHAADLVFIGEGPGFNEDQQGLPFVGKAGQLLDKMIGAMGFSQDEVYICNVVKCRPPENRTPRLEEARACARYLEPQLDLVEPKVIVALGRCAAENLDLVVPGGPGWRGRWGEWRGIPAMATYHPAFLLRSPHMKRPVWEDLQKVMARLGRAR